MGKIKVGTGRREAALAYKASVGLVIKKKIVEYDARQRIERKK